MAAPTVHSSAPVFFHGTHNATTLEHVRASTHLLLNKDNVLGGGLGPCSPCANPASAAMNMDQQLTMDDAVEPICSQRVMGHQKSRYLP